MPSRYSAIKNVLLDFLTQKTEYALQLNLNSFPNGLEEFAQSAGVSLNAQNREDNLLVRQAFWDLVGSGLAMPGDRSRHIQGNGDPYICVTDYGQRCAQEGKRLPIDSEGFLEEMNLDQVDDIIRLYIEEAVSSFSARNYLAAAAMAGGAMERAILVLTEEYEAKVPSGKKANYKTNVLSKEKIKTRFDKFLEFLETNGIKKVLSHADQETLDSLLPAIVNLIRITRNDVGHPTGREIERDEAEALIYLLKTALRFIEGFLV
ncbi:MAG: hypothetical protein PHH13_05795 [Candidatus Peribacteraceae bacterium]|nr:hypothetical protein [Candidatus Peribacteraceae bacterium]